MSATPDDLDPRQRRTRRALADAILTLAAEQPVRDISVTGLAKAASVHRSTVYQHAESPAGLLSDVLSRELDDVRDQFMGEMPSDDLPGLVHQVVMAVLEHLEKREAIYRRELADPTNHLHSMLRNHFAVSVEAVIRSYDLGPADLPAEDREAFVPIASRWVADATTGAMTVWLQGPKPRDFEAYARIHKRLLPPWWPVLP